MFLTCSYMKSPHLLLLYMRSSQKRCSVGQALWTRRSDQHEQQQRQEQQHITAQAARAELTSS